MSGRVCVACMCDDVGFRMLVPARASCVSVVVVVVVLLYVCAGAWTCASCVCLSL